MSSYNLSIPIEYKIPSLHVSNEVCKFPLRVSNIDKSGKYDYRYNNQYPTTQSIHVVTTIGSVELTTEGLKLTSASGSGAHVANHTDWHFSGNFSIKFKYKPFAHPSVNTEHMLLCKTNHNSNQRGWFIEYSTDSSNVKYMSFGYYSPDGTEGITGGTTDKMQCTLILNKFNTIEFLRSNNRWMGYVNGELIFDVSSTFAPTDSTAVMGIGYYPGTGESIANGIIRDIVITNGSGSRIPELILPQDVGVYNPHEVLNLELKRDVVDISAGCVKTQPSISKSVTTIDTVVFDNDALDITNGYVSISASTDFAVTTCCIRMYFYPTSVVDTGATTDYRRLISSGNLYSDNGAYRIGYGKSTSSSGVRWNLAFRLSGVVEDYTSDEVDQIPINTWNVFEFSRNGTVGIIRLNSKVVHTFTLPGNNLGHSSLPVYIGGARPTDADAANEKFKGFVKNVIFCKDCASFHPRYIKSFQDIRYSVQNTISDYALSNFTNDPITGYISNWIDASSLSSIHNRIRLHLNNTDAYVQTPYSFPTGWTRVFWSSSFQTDIVNGVKCSLVGSSSINRTGLQLNGTTDYAVDATSVDYDADTFGVIVTFTPTGPLESGSTVHTLIQRGTTGSAHWKLTCSDPDGSNNRDVTFVINNGTSDVLLLEGQVNWLNNQKKTIQVYREGLNARLVIDGTAILEVDDATTGLVGTGDIRIGAAINNSNYTKGVIQQVVILNGVILTSEESLLLYRVVDRPTEYISVSGITSPPRLRHRWPTGKMLSQQPSRQAVVSFGQYALPAISIPEYDIRIDLDVRPVDLAMYPASGPSATDTGYRNALGSDQVLTPVHALDYIDDNFDDVLYEQRMILVDIPVDLTAAPGGFKDFVIDIVDVIGLTEVRDGNDHLTIPESQSNVEYEIILTV